jgi:glucose dehydrogenase
MPRLILCVAGGSRFWVGCPAVANGVVYVGSEDGNVYALNATTGAKLWSGDTRDYVNSSPAVAMWAKRKMKQWKRESSGFGLSKRRSCWRA